MRPFDVKSGELLTDPLLGYDALHDDARAMLEFVATTCRSESLHDPVVTCFGRTRDDQEKLYLPAMLQRLEHDEAADLHATEAARHAARNLFSWHCLPIPEFKCRAFDLRSWVYTDPQRALLLNAVKAKYGNACEALDHAVPGGARHFHFAIKDPAGKPQNWR